MMEVTSHPRVSDGGCATLIGSLGADIETEKTNVSQTSSSSSTKVDHFLANGNGNETSSVVNVISEGSTYPTNMENPSASSEADYIMKDADGPLAISSDVSKASDVDVQGDIAAANQAIIHDVNIAEDGTGVNLVTEDVKTLLRCEQCEYSTHNKYNLKQHVDLVHFAERPFKCPFCDYAGKRSYSLKQHLVLHSSDLPYQCVYCKASFRKKGHLTNHVKMHATSKVFLCAICEKQLENEENLYAHLREHSPDEVYACDFCEYATTDNSSIVMHMHLHGNPTLYRCGKCDFTGLHKLSITQHMKSHSPDASYTVEQSTLNPKPVFLFKCPFCGYTTDSNLKLKSHLATHRSESSLSPHSIAQTVVAASSAASPETLYKCLNCQFSCQEASLFMKHMMQHGHNVPPSAADSSASSNKPGSFTYDAAASLYRCNICGYSCENQRTVKSHIWKHTGHKDIDYPMFKNGPISVFDDTPVGKPVVLSNQGAKDSPLNTSVTTSPAAISIVPAPVEGAVLMKAPLPAISSALSLQPAESISSTPCSLTSPVCVSESSTPVAAASSPPSQALAAVTIARQVPVPGATINESVPLQSVAVDTVSSDVSHISPKVEEDVEEVKVEITPEVEQQSETAREDGTVETRQLAEESQKEKESTVMSTLPAGEAKEVLLQVKKINSSTGEYEIEELVGQLIRAEDGSEVLVVAMDKDSPSQGMTFIGDTVEVVIDEGQPEDAGKDAMEAGCPSQDAASSEGAPDPSPQTDPGQESIHVESQPGIQTRQKRTAPVPDDGIPAKRMFVQSPESNDDIGDKNEKNVVVEKVSQVYAPSQIGLAACTDVGLQTNAPENDSSTSSDAFTQHSPHVEPTSTDDLNEKMDSDEENREIVVNECTSSSESASNVWSSLRQQSPGKTSTREELTALLALLKKGPHFAAAKPDRGEESRDTGTVLDGNFSRTQTQVKAKSNAKVKPLSEAQSGTDAANVNKPKSGICSSLLAVIEQLRERSKSESDTDDATDPGKSIGGKKGGQRSPSDQDAGIENHPNIERWGSAEEGVQFRCRLCHYASGNGWLMMSHMSIHKEKKPSECSLCDYVAVSSEDLQDHMLQHCKVRTYQCKLCPSVFHYKSQLRAHMRAHDTGPFTCRMCLYETDNPIVYRQHLQTHSEPQPNRQDALQTRIATNSLVSMAKTSPASSERIFWCSQCESSFETKDDLSKHTVHSACSAPSKDNYSEQFKCDACSFITSDIEKMKSHLTSHNKSCKFGRRYQCAKCDFTCHSHSAFKKHCRSHPDDMPIKCEFCDFSALSLRSLKSHMKRHANDQKFVQQPLEQYKCNLCGYVCHHLPSLKSHMWRHASDQNYSYEQTNDVINAAIDFDMVTSGADMHLPNKSVPPNDDTCFVTFRCCQCGFESLNKAVLNDHMKAHMDIIMKTFEVIKTPIKGGTNKSSQLECHPVVIKEECVQTTS